MGKDLDQGNPSTNSNSSPKKSLADSPRGLHNSLEGGLDDAELLKIGSPRNNTPKKEDLERTAKTRASERYPVPNKKTVKVLDKENVRPAVPTPSKKSPKKSYYPGLGPENSPLSPSRSVDSGLNKKEWVFATPEKPVGGYKKDRKVLGSIERGLDKMKNMLTPRKYETVHRPSVITGKALCNVSTTSNHNPDQVLDELTRALVAKGIPCQQKGYILRGKIKDASGMAKLSFELEVCRIPNLNVVGIRRKRLKVIFSIKNIIYKKFSKNSIFFSGRCLVLQKSLRRSFAIGSCVTKIKPFFPQKMPKRYLIVYFSKCYLRRI